VTPVRTPATKYLVLWILSIIAMALIVWWALDENASASHAGQHARAQNLTAGVLILLIVIVDTAVLRAWLRRTSKPQSSSGTGA
jgi:membrane protein implicated in regulation of membrane protease activity